MSYCIKAVRHGGDQLVVRLRCYGSPSCFANSLQLVCISGYGVSHLSLDFLNGESHHGLLTSFWGF